MTSFPLFEAETHPLADLAHQAEAGERIVLTEDGRPVAVIVPADDLDAIEDALDLRKVAEVRAEGAYLSLDETRDHWDRLDCARAEGNAELEASIVAEFD